MASFSRTSFVWGLVVLLALVCGANGHGFVGTNGTQFVLNGSPFLFNGFNSYWMMNIATEPTERYKVSEVFREAAAAGLTVCRTWAFSDGVGRALQQKSPGVWVFSHGGERALQITPGVYNEHVFQALDFVISEASKYGIRLIMSLVNNFIDYGGRAQYVKWARNAGVNATSDDDFYTNPVIKGFYKSNIRRIITRFNTITRIPYKDDPTIMAWELINEPRCDADYSGRTINGWVQEMASYVKSIDSRHLLEIGVEGFYGDTMPEKKQNNPGFQVGTDFISDHLIKEIDFSCIHAYPDQWLPKLNDIERMAFVQKWMTSHWEDSRTILKKPLVFAEFGKSSKDRGNNLIGRNAYMNGIYTSIYKYARSGGTFGGGLVWQLMAKGMEPFHDGYEIVFSKNSTIGRIISRQSSQMNALSHLLVEPHTCTTEQNSVIRHGRPLNRKHGHHA